MAAQVVDIFDGRFQRGLVGVLVQMEHALCVRREFDGADADLVRPDVEHIDDLYHEVK